MVSAPSQAAFFGCFALFNLCVALLIGNARPRRMANALAFVMFAANAVQAGAFALVTLGAFGESGGPRPIHDKFNVVTNLPVYAAFFVFPFVFPHRRLTRGRERLLFAGTGAWLVLSVLATILLPPEVVSNHPFNLVPNLLAFTPFFVALLVGSLLLVDTYLATPSHAMRDQARFILAAYMLKAWGSLGSILPLARNEGIPTAFASPAVLIAFDELVLGAAVLVPIGALAASWSRGRGVDAERSWRSDAFVVGVVLLAPIVWSGPFGYAEYYLIRPFLFAYAMLRFRLLEVDVHARRGLVGATLLAGMAGAFVGAVVGLQNVGVDAGVAVAIGFVVTVGAVGLLVWPLVRWMLGPTQGDMEARDREVYRAALEEVVAAERVPDAARDVALRGLRAKLAISDREHALMEAGVRADSTGPREIAIGRLFLGRYRVERRLGEGGFGRTFLAHDEAVDRLVVIKTSRVADEREARRLFREGRVLAKLSHLGIVLVFDIERVAGEVFLVMEYVEGGSLADRLRAGPVPWQASVSLVSDVADALAAAHAKGIVHRDVKPANILLTAEGRAKLADLGIAHAPAGSGTVSGLSAEDAAGSVPYMSPEQVRGEALDARSDLYSLGVVWYETITGSAYLNLAGRGEFETRRAILEEAPKLPLDGIPPGVNALLSRLLAKDPSERPASADELRVDLGECVTLATTRA